MKQSSLSLILFLTTWFVSFSQNQIKPLYSISVNNVHKVAVDNLLNVYTISDFEIKKYNKQDTLFTRFSELNYGKISSVDFSNPLRIPVFYADFNKLIVLDNTLNYLKDPIDLLDEGYNQINAICSSYDGGLWMYSREDFSLNRYTVNLLKDRSVPNLNTILDSELEVVSMLERDNRLYMLASNKKIYVFDIYGAFIKSIPLNIDKEFVVYGQKIYWMNNHELFWFDLLSFNTNSYLLPDTEIRSFSIHSNRLVLLTKTKVAVYSIEN